MLLQEAETIPLLENAFTSLSSATGQAASTHKLGHEVTEIESTPPHEPGRWLILTQLVGPSHPVLGEKQAEDGFQEWDRFALLRQHYITSIHINMMLPTATAQKEISHTQCHTPLPHFSLFVRHEKGHFLSQLPQCKVSIPTDLVQNLLPPPSLGFSLATTIATFLHNQATSSETSASTYNLTKFNNLEDHHLQLRNNLSG